MLNRPICTRLDHKKPSSTAQSTCSKDQQMDNHDKYCNIQKESGNAKATRKNTMTAETKKIQQVDHIQLSNQHFMCCQEFRDHQSVSDVYKMVGSCIILLAR